MDKPSTFIGSSMESIGIARQVQFELRDDTESKLWTQGAFRLSLTYLESLSSEIERHDFAIFILAPDDVVISRDNIFNAPRDNVLFELGLFMGRLGRNRVFVMYNKDATLKILSDLSGFTMADYSGDWVKRDLPAAIGTACQPIRRASQLAQRESRLPFNWLYKEEVLARIEENVECTSVWVITPDLYHAANHPTFRHVIENNLKRGVTYTYVFPDTEETASFLTLLRSVYSSYPSQLIERPMPYKDFRRMAVSHYVVFDPFPCTDKPPNVFLELPVSSREFWIEVDTRAARDFYSRFYPIVKGQRPWENEGMGQSLGPAPGTE